MKEGIIYNPINDKSPQGACRAGGEVCYTLKISHIHSADEVFLILIDDLDNSVKRIKMPIVSDADGCYTFKATLTYENAGLFWYYFEVRFKGGKYFLCKTKSFDAEPTAEVRESWAQIVYKTEPKTNKAFQSGVMYHIFVDRFKKSGTVISKNSMVLRKDWGGEITENSTDFIKINKECFGGNLQGITNKLDYIKKLGVSTIFLSPIFDAYSYHKYDVADFEHIDTMLGGEEAFDALIKTAKAQGINILLDGVFNHVGSDSIYFNKLNRFKSQGAYQSKQSKYYDWFTFEEFPDKYSSWWSIDTLPQFNESNVKLQEYMAGVNGIITKYMKKGILGYRLDVADELTDPFLDKICKRTRVNKADAIILGEVWEDAATKIAYDKRRHYFSGVQLNSVMNYPLKNAILEFVCKGNAEALQEAFYLIHDHYPLYVQRNLMNFLGTHDTKRILTVLDEAAKERGDNATAINMLKIASAIQYCAMGVPAVFYGDEVGVHGGEAPFCRVCFPWGAEDKNILAWYKKLGNLRSGEIFAAGDCKVILAHSGVFIFERTYKKQRIIIAANSGQEEFLLNLSAPFTDFETEKIVKDSVTIKPLQFFILKSS